MTDYNDGKWHIWDGRNGDRCPVHPDSRIDLQYWHGPGYTQDRAGLHDWQGPLMFRVTKPAPVVEKVTLHSFHETGKGFCIQYDLIDGKPDPASIRMEKLT